jgi:hypothetical protein
MTKYTVFFDESGDDHLKVFAGFAAADEQWEMFEREWAERLKKFDAPPLHMRTFAHSRDEFSSWKGDEERRKRFLESLIGLIQIRLRTFFAAVVLVDDFNEVATKYPEIRESYTPFGIAANSCIKKVVRWMEKYKIPFGDVSLIFEDGAGEKKAFVREAKQRLGFTPVFAKKGQYPAAFQAADLLAFEYLQSNRSLVAKAPEQLTLSELRKPIQALVAAQPQSASPQWGIHNKWAIEQGWLQTRNKTKA